MSQITKRALEASLKKLLIFIPHLHILRLIFDDLDHQIIRQTVQIFFYLISADRMICIHHKCLILAHRFKDTKEAFLPGIIGFILTQYPRCILYTHPLYQIIDIFKMIVKCDRTAGCSYVYGIQRIESSGRFYDRNVV